MKGTKRAKNMQQQHLQTEEASFPSQHDLARSSAMSNSQSMHSGQNLQKLHLHSQDSGSEEMNCQQWKYKVKVLGDMNYQMEHKTFEIQLAHLTLTQSLSAPLDLRNYYRNQVPMSDRLKPDKAAIRSLDSSVLDEAAPTEDESLAFSSEARVLGPPCGRQGLGALATSWASGVVLRRRDEPTTDAKL
ncbi:hypothetical protein C4D60_Mb10t04590 [Musa balbisiana]|uniref:Uncharacterized protein n=1 Tax=Musa balbisiana TaxID=52838 RepID=A0A4S8IUM5_MUSBA|nr:hypothetical protein C4D60_Mb10t04590 [Musa balbisiana]